MPFGPPRVTSRSDLQQFDTNKSLELNALILRDTLEYFLFEQLVQALSRNVNNPLTDNADDDDVEIDVEVKAALRVTKHTFFPGNFTLRQQRRPKETVTNTCTSNRCAAKVVIAANKTINDALLARAIDLLVQRKGFRKVFIGKPWAVTRRPLRPNRRFWEVTFKFRLTRAQGKGQGGGGGGRGGTNTTD